MPSSKFLGCTITWMPWQSLIFNSCSNLCLCACTCVCVCMCACDCLSAGLLNKLQWDNTPPKPQSVWSVRWRESWLFLTLREGGLFQYQRGQPPPPSLCGCWSPSHCSLYFPPLCILFHSGIFPDSFDRHRQSCSADGIVRRRDEED